MAISPTTVPRVLNTPYTNPNITTKSHTILFLKSCLILGRKASFFIPAEDDGGVGGLSRNKNRINAATTVPIIAWQSKELKICVLALSLF